MKPPVLSVKTKKAVSGEHILWPLHSREAGRRRCRHDAGRTLYRRAQRMTHHPRPSLIGHSHHLCRQTPPHLQCSSRGLRRRWRYRHRCRTSPSMSHSTWRRRLIVVLGCCAALLAYVHERGVEPTRSQSMPPPLEDATAMFAHGDAQILHSKQADEAGAARSMRTLLSAARPVATAEPHARHSGRGSDACACPVAPANSLTRARLACGLAMELRWRSRRTGAMGCGTARRAGPRRICAHRARSWWQRAAAPRGTAPGAAFASDAQRDRVQNPCRGSNAQQ